MSRFWSVPRGSLLFACLLILLASPASAQDEEELEVGRWYPALEAGLILNQSSFSGNWAGGDNGQFAWTFLAAGGLKSQITDVWNLQNTLVLAYGKTAQADDEGNYGKPKKSTDRIDLESILRATYGFHVDPYASLRVESQFEDASDPLNRGSFGFNPVFIKEAVGVSHDFYGEENRQFLVRFGGAIRQTIRKQYVNEDPALDPTQLAVSETETGADGGLELVIDYKDQYSDEKFAWSSKLSLYKPLYYSSRDEIEGLDFDAPALIEAGVPRDLADYTTTMDVDWENVFTAQITQYLNVNLYFRAVFDKYDTSVEAVFDENDVLTNPRAVAEAARPGVQFKQTLGLGITYRFF